MTASKRWTHWLPMTSRSTSWCLAFRPREMASNRSTHCCAVVFPTCGSRSRISCRVIDRVAVRVTVRGTHDGAFLGRPATGRAFAVSAVGIFRIRAGRIVEHWGVFDQLAMLSQLGAMGTA